MEGNTLLRPRGGGGALPPDPSRRQTRTRHRCRRRRRVELGCCFSRRFGFCPSGGWGLGPEPTRQHLTGVRGEHSPRGDGQGAGLCTQRVSDRRRGCAPEAGLPCVSLQPPPPAEGLVPVPGQKVLGAGGSPLGDSPKGPGGGGGAPGHGRTGLWGFREEFIFLGNVFDVLASCPTQAPTHLPSSDPSATGDSGHYRPQRTREAPEPQ